MSSKQIFQGLTFICLPKKVSKNVIKFRKQTLTSRGAVVRYDFKRLKDATHVVIDRDKLQNPKQIVEEMNLIEISEDFSHKHPMLFLEIYELLTKKIVVDEKWASDCIDKKTLLDCNAYKIEIEPELRQAYERVIGKIDLTSDEEPLAKRQKIESGEPEKKKYTPLPIHSANYITNVLNGELLKPEAIESNPNIKTLRVLNELRDQYNAQGDDFRVKGYDSAINALQLCHNTLITNAKDAINLQGIGTSIAAKIEEYCKTGTIKQLQQIKNNPDIQLLDSFNKVYGVGPKISKYWFDKYKLRSIEDVKLQQEQLGLNELQKLGLKYYSDWLLPINREASKLHLKYVEGVAKSFDQKVEVYLMGSYRRGLPVSHDIDFIITRPDYDTKTLRESKLVQNIVKACRKSKYIECVLSESKYKFLLGARLTDTHSEEHQICRRVDFLFVPWQQLGAAMMYFTGNNVFNRMVRQLASSKGYLLNGHGLYTKDYGQLGSGKRKRTSTVSDDEYEDMKDSMKNSYLVESFDEKKIFKILGIRWHEPSERNIGDLRLAR